MVLLQVIFGKVAIREFDETGIMPSDKWLEENGCVVDEKDFKTQGECDAYIRGIEEANGWEEIMTLNSETIETPDCTHCHDWRSFFSDRERVTYCPDCAKEIIEATIKYDVYTYNGKVYAVRIVDIPGLRDNAIIGSDELALVLMNEEPTSTPVANVDEEIIFYVPQTMLQLPDSELIKYVLKNIE